jgi:hypothetical protein
MRQTVFPLLLMFCAGVSPARCALITSFQDAFQLTTPAPGWAYLWNNNGPIGNPANYTPLLPNSSGTYTNGGVEMNPSPAPGNFISFGLPAGVPGGHPAMGSQQTGSGGIERYCIALYTLPISADISIVDGWMRNSNPNSGGSTDGVSLKVFVNDEQIPRIMTGTARGYDSTVTFNADLGNLNAGDRIYLAMGSNQEDLFDSFQLRYSFVSVPEPCGLAFTLVASNFFAAIFARLPSRYVLGQIRSSV